MKEKISVEECIRNQLALKVAMESVGAKTINAFSTKLKYSRKNNTPPICLNLDLEGVVPGARVYLKNRQIAVNEELFQIDRNRMARECSDNPVFMKYQDEEKYWLSLINPVRFHRINKGKASSKVPTRMMTMHDKALEDGDFGDTVFDVKNIWYFLKPFVGEKAYLAYKYGPQAFYHNSSLNLWSLLFDKLHPDDVIANCSIHNPLCLVPDYELMSAEELSRVLVKHYEKIGPNSLSNGQGFGALLYIAVLKLAYVEQTFRKIPKNYSDQLYQIVLRNVFLSILNQTSFTTKLYLDNCIRSGDTSSL